jgi:hypothetical protein
MINKVLNKGKCPFRNLEECSDECAFFRKGVRFNEKKQESYAFEECAINIIADNLEAMHQRTYAMQREVGETKNVMAFKILSDLGMVSSEEAAKRAQAIINIPEDKKLLK